MMRNIIMRFKTEKEKVIYILQKKNRNYKTIWGHIPPWNKASEVMHLKLGFQRYQMISYHSIAGISWTTCNPVKLIQRVEG